MSLVLFLGYVGFVLILFSFSSVVRQFCNDGYLTKTRFEFLAVAVALLVFVVGIFSTLPRTEVTTTYSDYKVANGKSQVYVAVDDVEYAVGKAYAYFTDSETGEPYVEVVVSRVDSSKFNGFQKFMVGDASKSLETSDFFSRVSEVNVYE